MTKTNKSTMVDGQLPAAPWIYINDPTKNGRYAQDFVSLLPKALYLRLHDSSGASSFPQAILKTSQSSNHVIVVDRIPFYSTGSSRFKEVQFIRQAAISQGRNFASVNLIDNNTSMNDRSARKSWGTNHLTHPVDIDPDPTTVRAVSEKIYRWLFDVLSVLETLHLIPDSQMKDMDPNSTFKDYEYCPLIDAHKNPKDTRIQFVALILDKPVVGPKNRISFKVADKSGIATFFFQYRGPSSQYTWDWVLSLKPGDRKCLPRMPCVLIKERPIKTIIKAPFRITSFAVVGSAVVIRKVGSGLIKFGNKIRLGNRVEWVPELDVTTDANGRKIKKYATDGDYDIYEPFPPTDEFQVFTTKGEKTWNDNDSIASTSAGTVHNEKV